MKRLSVVVLGILFVFCANAIGGYSSGFVISEEEDFGLKLGGRIQSRYEYFSPEAGEDLSSFYLRRVRLDFRGHDYAAATADMHFSFGCFSGAFDYYLRHVSPEERGRYRSEAYLVTAGLMLLKETLEAVGRYSERTPDTKDSGTVGRELGAGFNVYHRGHDYKTRINYFKNKIGGNTDRVFLVETHLSF